MSRAIGPLASFDEGALRELAPRGAARSFPKNAVIINESDQTDSLYILLSGRAKVFVSEEDGREVVLSTIREGDYFGELVLDGGPRSASIMTLEPCRCFVIPHRGVARAQPGAMVRARGTPGPMSQTASPFADLDESALRALAPHGAVRSFAKNAVVVSEGDETDSLYILLSGRVKAFVSEEDGREVVLSTVGVGDYFGEMVLDGGPRSASIMTLEPCRFFVIPRGDIEGLIDRNPAFARHLIRMLIGKVRSLTRKVLDLALKDVYGRFAKFVDENAVEQKGARVVPERLTQHDIAARIGGSPVHKKLPAQW